LSAELHKAEYVPTPLRKMVHSTVGKILSKGPLTHATVDCRSTLTSRYLGGDIDGRALIDDLVGTAENSQVVLGTDSGFWEPSVVEIGCTPPPPGRIALHFSPGLPTPQERRAARAKWFADRKILVVGGQVDRHIKQNLLETLGVSPNNFSWIPSEYNKKASNIGSVIKGLQTDSSIVICITGKVGHSTSRSVEVACRKGSIAYNYVEFASGLGDLLEEIFESQT
jgi:hypothetical protein